MYKRGRKMWKYIFSVLVAARKNYDHKDYISMDKNFGA